MIFRRLHSLYFLIAAICIPLSACEGDLTDSRVDGVDEAAWPGQVAGANLANYSNSRIRCGFTRLEENQYQTNCDIVIVDKNNNEIKANSIAAGFSLAWQPIQLEFGELDGTPNCNVLTNKLSQSCDLATKSTSVKLKAEIKLREDKTKKTRSETETILLPFSLSVAAGYVSSIPFTFTQGEPSKESPEDTIKLGYQPLDLNPLSLDIHPMRWCVRDDKLYFTTSRQIYVTSKGTTWLFAGAPTIGPEPKELHRNRLQIKDALIYCAKGGVFSYEASKKRILSMPDDGTVHLIASDALHVAENRENAIIYARKEIMPSPANGQYFQFKKSDILGNSTTMLDSFPTKAALATNKSVTCLEKTCYLTSNVGGIIYSSIQNTLLIQMTNSVIENYFLAFSEATNIISPVTFFPDDIAMKLQAPQSIAVTMGAMTDVNGDFKIQHFTYKIDSATPLLKEFILTVIPDGYSTLQSKPVGQDYDDFKKYLASTGDPNYYDAHYYFSFSVDPLNGKKYFCYGPGSTLQAYQFDGTNKFSMVLQYNPSTYVSFLDPSVLASHSIIKQIDSIDMGVDGSIYYLKSGNLYKISPEGQQILMTNGGTGVYDSKNLKEISPILNIPYPNAIRSFALTSDESIVVALSDRIMKIHKDYSTEILANMGYANNFTATKSETILFSGPSLNIFAIDKSNNLKLLLNLSEFFSKTREIITPDLGTKNDPVLSIEDLVYKNGKIYIATRSSILQFNIDPISFEVDKSSLIMSSSNPDMSPDSRLFETGSSIIRQPGAYSNIKSIVVDDQSNLYVSGLVPNQITQLDLRNSRSPHELFFGPSLNDQDCGAGKIAFKSKAQQIDSDIQTGLSRICAGNVTDIVLRDLCDHPDPTKREIKMAFAQQFAETQFNIVTLSKPCKSSR